MNIIQYLNPVTSINKTKREQSISANEFEHITKLIITYILDIKEKVFENKEIAKEADLEEYKIMHKLLKLQDKLDNKKFSETIDKLWDKYYKLLYTDKKQLTREKNYEKRKTGSFKKKLAIGLIAAILGGNLFGMNTFSKPDTTKPKLELKKKTTYYKPNNLTLEEISPLLRDIKLSLNKYFKKKDYDQVINKAYEGLNLMMSQELDYPDSFNELYKAYFHHLISELLFKKEIKNNFIKSKEEILIHSYAAMKTYPCLTYIQNLCLHISLNSKFILLRYKLSYAMAIDLINETIKNDPNHERIHKSYMIKAQILLKLGKKEEAIKNIEEAIKKCKNKKTKNKYKQCIKQIKKNKFDELFMYKYYTK